MQTKHVESSLIARYAEIVNIHFEEGRSEAAPELTSIMATWPRGSSRATMTEDRGEREDAWRWESDSVLVRDHRVPRRRLFSPGELGRHLSSKGMNCIQMKDRCEEFSDSFRDCMAHRRMPSAGVGCTKFELSIEARKLVSSMNLGA